MTLRNRLLGIAVSAQPQQSERVRWRGRAHVATRAALPSHALSAPPNPKYSCRSFSFCAKRGQKRVLETRGGQKECTCALDMPPGFFAGAAGFSAAVCSLFCFPSNAFRLFTVSFGCPDARVGHRVFAATKRKWRIVRTTQGSDAPWAALQMMRRRAREQHEWCGCEQQRQGENDSEHLQHGCTASMRQACTRACQPC